MEEVIFMKIYHGGYFSEVYENYNSVCSDTTSIPRVRRTKGHGGLGRGLERKTTYARGTPFVSETQPSCSQVPPKSSHKRTYDSALFASANKTNIRPTIGFGVYSDPTTGTQVFNPGTLDASTWENKFEECFTNQYRHWF